MKKLILGLLFLASMSHAQVVLPGPGGSVNYKQTVASPAGLPVVGNVPGDARVTLSNTSIYIWDGAVWNQVPSIGAISVAWGAITGTLSNQIDLQNALNLKQSTSLTSTHLLVGNGSNLATDVAASGDLTLANTGAFTFNTVNGTPGTYGNASNTCSIIVNNKGLITSSSQTAIQIAESQVTNLVSDLAGKQASLTFGSISSSTIGVSVGSGSNSTVGPNVTVDVQTASGSQPGLLSSADWTTFNGKQAAGNYITALTGDLTATGPGSVASTLATVNGNIGSFTNAAITVNGKGLVTAASSGITGNLTDAGTDGITVTSGTGAVLGSGTSIAQHVSDTTHAGYLSSTDWNIFSGKFTLPSFTLGSVLFSDGSTIVQDNTKFFWDDTNFQLSLGGHLHTAGLGISQTGGSTVGFDLTTTNSNTAMQVQNQGAQIAANFITAANSATQGGSVILGASRGTNASRTASLAGDQIGLFAGQAYNSSNAFGPGYVGAFGFIATENQTSTGNGGEIVMASTANGALAPTVGFVLNQDQTIQMNHYTANGFVKFTGAAGTLGVDTSTYLTGNQTITLSGDTTGSGTTAITTTLATVNGNVGSFGSASSSANFTVNAKGLITAAGSNAIQITQSQITTQAAQTISSNTSLASPNKFYFGNTSGGSFNATFPAASANSGVVFCTKNITFGGANLVNLVRTGSDLFEGATSDSIAAGESKCYASDGVSNWYLI